MGFQRLKTKILTKEKKKKENRTRKKNGWLLAWEEMCDGAMLERDPGYVKNWAELKQQR